MNRILRAEDAILAELARHGGAGRVSTILLFCFEGSEFSTEELTVAAKNLARKNKIQIDGDETEVLPYAEVNFLIRRP